ncbi:MAG: hypothetical protein ACT4QA_12690 [Panacagrimonas sp.]
MNVTDVCSASRRNPRALMSEADRAAVETLMRRSRDEAERRVAQLADRRRLDLTRALNAATQKLFASNPDFPEIGKKLMDRFKPDLDDLKVTGRAFDEEVFRLPARRGVIDLITPGDSYSETRERLRLLDKLGVTPAAFGNPPFAGELWWGETKSFWSGHGLVVDINEDPPRIWGCIDYDGDPLLSGGIGFSMFFFLTPDRFPVFRTRSFEIRPLVQISGSASAWTGIYHPIWHADDKWSKCWQTLRMTATLSSGEPLDSVTLGSNLFFLENEYPFGQSNASLTTTWQPVLRFGADLADLRARGVSIVLEAAFRYDYQLEGDDSLLCLGSGSGGPGPDDAVSFRMVPGSVLVV